MVEPVDIATYLRKGEGPTVEFKRCGNQPEDDTYETICSFANRSGGHIFLGVSDNGTPLGLREDRLLAIERTVANTVSNPKLFNAAPSVEFERYEYEGRHILRIWVAFGPTVYRYKGNVYDRVADTDVQLRTDDQISALYLRKRNYYTEQKIYPYLRVNDLRPDLLQEARRLASARRSDHPWLTMTDEELLTSARLYARNWETGEEGLNLAAILLLGRDEIIGSVCPAYKTDAVTRRVDLDRYDDRIVVRTNLMDAYDLLMEFIKKHTPDPFFLEGSQAVSPRDIIGRELVSNTLIHREYTSPFPAKLIIDNDGIHTENASRSLYEGRVTLSDFNPMPKNPIIADFFVQIGRAEELGSGTRNLFKYAPAYGGADPLMTDGDIFRTSVRTPLNLPTSNEETTGTAVGTLDSTKSQVTASIEDAIDQILAQGDLLDTNSLAAAAGVTPRTARRYVARLLEEGKLVAYRNGRTRYFTRP